ncbi:MAG: L,D-transpeptidase [Bacilli bacterium]|nr:L,D-transpeptidase [Bacilli bacterium]
MNKNEIKALFLSVLTSLSFIFLGVKYNIHKRNTDNKITVESIIPNVNSTLVSNIPLPEKVITDTILQEDSYVDERVIDSNSLYDNYGNIILDCNNFGYINTNECLTYDGFQEGKQINGYIDIYQKVLRVKSNGIYDYVITPYGDGVFVESKNVSIIENTYIEIDISDQILYFYQDNQFVLSSPIVTGMNETPTYNGYFYIYSKETDVILKSENYNYQQPVSFWMPFNGGIGLHDATWRDRFGEDIYKYSGSHGCVNLPYEIALFLYQNTWTNYYNDGTKVLVHD